MAAPHIAYPAGLLGEAPADANHGLMRSLLQTTTNALLSAGAVVAECGRADPARATQRNGCRHRDLDTRVGTIGIAIPQLRSGTYYPDWLREERKGRRIQPVNAPLMVFRLSA